MIWFLAVTNVLTLALLWRVAWCSKHNQLRWVGHWEAACAKWHETYEAKVDAELAHRKELRLAKAEADAARTRLDLARGIDPQRDPLWV